MTAPTASFDVFDTLLTRIWAEPVDLFVRVGENLLAAGLSGLAPEEYALRRIAAEKTARTDSCPEITFAEIFEVLGRTLQWQEATIRAAMEAEIAVEEAGIRVVPGMLDQVSAERSRCGRVIFLSDMYLPTAVVQRWLQQAGFYVAGDLLLMSGDVRTGKGSGGLFHQARRESGGDFGAWTHTGDNPGSDQRAPRRLGIDSHLRTDARLSFREQQLRGTRQIAESWRSLLAGAARQARLDRPPGCEDERRRQLWETGATVAGPLFFAFTTWCREEARRRGIRNLHFLARGGQIFHRIADLIEQQRPGGPRSHYLNVSRLAVAGTIPARDPEALRQLAMRSGNFHSVRQALAHLGVADDPAFAPPAWPRSEWDRNLARSERQALGDWLLTPERISRLQAALSERARRARAYCHTAGLHEGASSALVDTGWMGTIQKNLEASLGDNLKPVPLTGFYLGLRPRATDDCCGEMVGYTNTFNPLVTRGEMTLFILIELMARGDHGPVLGFESEDGNIFPRFGPVNETCLEETRLFQSAVLSFTRHFLKAAPGEGPPEEPLATVVSSHYQAFAHHPTASEARTFGRIPYSDQLLEHRYDLLCPEMTLLQVGQAIANHRHRPSGWWLAGQAQLGHAPLLHAFSAWKSLSARLGIR